MKHTHTHTSRMCYSSGFLCCRQFYDLLFCVFDVEATGKSVVDSFEIPSIDKQKNLLVEGENKRTNNNRKSRHDRRRNKREIHKRAVLRCLFVCFFFNLIIAE